MRAKLSEKNHEVPMTSLTDDCNRKRNFDRTAEPPGTADGHGTRLRFAVQHPSGLARPLRLASRVGWRAAELGRSEGAILQPAR